MNVYAILHTSFLVSDLDRARAFYEGVLGLAVDPGRPDLGFPGAWYRIGAGQQIHLMQLPESGAGLPHSGYPGRDRHVALAVDDLVELARRLDDAGVACARSKSGRPALFCRDPDGNALEFVGHSPEIERSGYKQAKIG